MSRAMARSVTASDPSSGNRVTVRYTSSVRPVFTDGVPMSRPKPGTGSRGFMDAGIVWKGERPLFILTAYTDHVPAALPDGTPGFTAANTLIGRMARVAYDTLGG